MKILLFIVLAFGLVALAVLAYEIPRAKEVDPKEPFLYGDYDPKKDPTLESLEMNENASVAQRIKNCSIQLN